MSKNAGYKKLIAAGRKNKYRIAGAAVAVAVCAASLIKKAHKNGSKTVSYKLPHEGDIILYRYSFLMADNKNGYVDINTSGCGKVTNTSHPEYIVLKLLSGRENGKCFFIKKIFSKEGLNIRKSEDVTDEKTDKIQKERTQGG